MKEDRAKWDKRYKGDVCLYGQEANGFLIDNIHLLPEGRVLDIAAGEGRNSVFFAEHGYKVDAVDISEAGLKKAQRLAGEAGAEIHCIHADLETYRIQENAYDVIANFNYLQRNLILQIKRGLKIGGAVIFETYLMDQTALSSGPKNPDHLLRHNELLGFFKDFRVLVYREGIYGERGRERAIAGIIATKE